MKNFFWRSFAASALSTFIIGFGLMIIFIVMVAGIFSGKLSGLADFGGKPLEIKDNSILHMTLRGNIADRSSVMLLQDEVFPMGGQGLYDMTEAIRYAATDDRIKGILLEVDVVTGGLANLKDIRDELIRFKESGKFVVAYSNAYTQTAYYIASAADEIHLYPLGYLQINGLVARVMFVKEMLAKLEIEPQIIRGSNNKYKSAVEPLIATEMSPANKEQNLRFISGMWNMMADEISKSRKFSADYLNTVVDSMPYMTGKEAMELKLVDGNITRTQLETNLKERIKSDTNPNMVSFYRYCRWVREQSEKTKFPASNIAVIYAQGEIGMDEGDRNSIGTANLPKPIKQARLNPLIKAVVLRVNSPGGAVLTSDIVYRELELLLETKPVVVSMGNVAASGGYYISLPANKVFASPMTITGSIGVFGVWPNVQGLMENKLGIHTDYVSTHKQGDFGSINRPLNEKEYARIQREIDQTYLDFTTIVSKWRKPLNTPADVDSIGQGRVWNGIDALEIGLIDAHGSLYDAIAHAAELGGVSNPVIMEFPRYKLEGLDALFAMFESLDQGESDVKTTENKILKVGKMAGELINHLEYFNSIDNMKGVQARMLWNIWFE